MNEWNVIYDTVDYDSWWEKKIENWISSQLSYYLATFFLWSWSLCYVVYTTSFLHPPCKQLLETFTHIHMIWQDVVNTIMMKMHLIELTCWVIFSRFSFFIGRIRRPTARKTYWRTKKYIYAIFPIICQSHRKSDDNDTRRRSQDKTSQFSQQKKRRPSTTTLHNILYCHIPITFGTIVGRES